MSAKAVGRIWESGLKGNQLTIMLALADHADHLGHNVYPSVNLIMWKTSLSERTVRRILSQFRSNKYVSVVKRSSQHYPTNYSILFENLPVKNRYVRPDKVAGLTLPDEIGPENSSEISPVTGGRSEEDSSPDKLAGLNNLPDLPNQTSDLPDSALRPAIAVAGKPINHQKNHKPSLSTDASIDLSKEWDKKTQIEKAHAVLNLLNAKTNRQGIDRFKTLNPNGKPTANAKNVIDRVKDGYDMQAFAYVVNSRCDKWIGKEQEEYLRPKTLFNRTNFETYLADKRGAAA